MARLCLALWEYTRKSHDNLWYVQLDILTILLIYYYTQVGYFEACNGGQYLGAHQKAEGAVQQLANGIWEVEDSFTSSYGRVDCQA